MNGKRSPDDDRDNQERKQPEPTCWGYGVWPTDDDEEGGEQGTSSSGDRTR